jgi:prophage regulatory protein
MNRIIREKECRDITGLSRTTRWRMEQDGDFPKRTQISKRLIGWDQGDIEAWLQSRKGSVAWATSHDNGESTHHA